MDKATCQKPSKKLKLINTEAAIEGVLLKEMYLKIPQISQEPFVFSTQVTPTQVFSCEICEKFRKTCFEEHLQTSVNTFQMYNKSLFIPIWMHKRLPVNQCSFLNIYKHTNFQHRCIDNLLFLTLTITWRCGRCLGKHVLIGSVALDQTSQLNLFNWWFSWCKQTE